MTDNPTEKLELILGADGLARLQASTVMVLGLGGVGSNCTEALARGGVGALILLDFDVVSPSNINRQSIAFQSTVGKPKVEVMAAMIADINPAIHVTKVPARLWSENAVSVLEPYGASIDYLVDCIDAISVKLTLAAWAQDQPFKMISAMGAANKLRPECLRVADLYETVNDPLSRIMRKEGRKRGIRSLKVLYSCEEAAHPPIPDGTERRQRLNLGTVSYMPAIMGLEIAGEVIRDLAFGDRRETQ